MKLELMLLRWKFIDCYETFLRSSNDEMLDVMERIDQSIKKSCQTVFKQHKGHEWLYCCMLLYALSAHPCTCQI